MADNQPFFAPLFDTTEDTNASIYQLPPLQEALKSEPAAAPAVKSRGMPSAADVSRRAEELGIDPKFALSIFKQESSGNFNERDSNKGAIGGMQVMPGTYKAMMGTTEGMRDPWNNLEAGLRYIAYGQRTLGTKDPALLAAGYHAGYDRKDLKQGIIPDVSDGAKRTRDYAREVAARAGGSAPAGKVASADSAAPAPPSIPSLQSALDAQEPGRYEVLADPGADVLTRLNTGDDKDRYELASPDEISRFEAGKKESVGDAAKSFLGKSLKAGMYDLAGAGAKLLDAVNPWTLSESDAATLFKNDPAKLKDYQDNSVAMILSRFARRMSHNSEDAMKEISPGAELRYGHKEYATTDLDKAAYASPVKVIGDVVRNLPTQVGLAISAYLTRGAAAQAEAQALKAGLTAEAAKQAAIQAGAKTMATMGAVSEGAIGYAQQANQAREEAEKVKQADLEKSPEYQKLLANGYTPETAKQKLAAVTAEQAGVVAGVVDAAVNKVGGHFLGKIMTEGGKFVPRVMKGFVNEGATEAIQSPGEQYAQNAAVKRNMNPNQSETEGLLENAVQGLVVGGVSGGGFAGAMGRGHSPNSAAPNNAAPAASAAPAAPAAPENQAPAAPAAPAAAAPAVPAAPVAEPAAPAGPIERAVGKVVPESKQVVGDDGTVYNVKVGDSGVEVAAIDPAAQAAPALTEREKALQEIGDKAASEKPPKPEPAPKKEQEPAAKVEEAKSASDEEPAAKAPAGPTDTRAPAGADLSTMDEPALRERMKYLAGQAKRTGGWDKMLVTERKRVEAEIGKRKNGQPAAQVEQAAEPAPEKTASGAFVKQSDANDAMRTAARDTSKPHQVVEREEAGRAVFDVRPMEEANGANARRAEPAGAPVTAAEQASAAPAAPAAERPARAAKTAPAAGEPGAAAGEATAEPAALTVKAASGKVYPTKGERLPKAGVVPANLGNDGIVYVGRPNSLHFHVADRHSKAAGGFSDTGFVTPDGQYLTREEALAWVNAHEAKVKPSENMGASLDAIDYREQVPESKRKAPEAAKGTAAEQAAAPAEPVKWFGTREKAEAHIAKKGMGDTHEVVQAQNRRFEIHPKVAEGFERFAPETGTLGIPRDEMPQVPSQSHGALVNHLNAQGIEHETKMVPADELKPTQAEFSPEKVEQAKEATGDRAVIVSNDGHIIDGHHQVLAAKDEGNDVKAIVLDAPVDQVLEAVKNSPSAQVEQPADAAPAEQPAASANESLFANNKLFTEDSVEKARARMRRKLKTTAFTGLDPELVTDGMTIAGAYIEAGVREFGAYAKAMIDDFGAEVKPYLLSFYEAVRHFPGLETEGMTAPQEAGRLHAELLSQNETAQEAQHDTEANPARPGAGDEGQNAAAVRGDEGGRDAGRVSEPADGGRAGVAGRGAQRAGERSAVPEDQRPANADAGGEQSAEGSRERGATAGSRGDQQPASAAANHRIRPGDLKREGSWKDTAERNVQIVELVKQLEKDGRVATPDERASLARYTGWGASEIANGIFPDRNGNYKPGWKELGERLKAALTPAEYADARRTMQYAHYTSEGVIRAIYAGLDRLGFKGGAILEPGMGVGHFNGLMPAQMAAHSSYTGIEFDPITGAIARALYPQSNVIVGDYTKTALPKDFFDAAIGNPPFSSTVVSNDAEYKKHGFMLHDYFFAKTLDRVKPGGVVAFVTSKGTMDKASSRAREFMAERANLIGAVRLPQTAFKENAGTEVVTDVLFLQKRGPGIPDKGVKWLGTKEVDTSQGKTPVNEYFADHPEMVLGEHAKTGSMYRADEYTVVPRAGEDIEQAFAKAIQNLPEGGYRPARGSAAERAFVQDRDFNPKAKKEGGLYVADDGRLMQVEDGAGADLTHRLNSEGKRIELKPKERAWLRGWVSLRDALKQAQLDQLTDGDWQGSLQALNAAYDAFVKDHGNILAFSTIERENPDGTTSVTRRLKNAPLMTIDAEGALAHALERINEDGTISKGAVLQDRVLKRPTEPVINTTQDAMFVALDRHGKFDLDTVARLAGQSREQAIADLGTAVYEAPGASWQMADEYLSGNVVRKLKEAQTAAEIDKRYSRNVEALRAVQPRPLGPQDISVKLGANWVKPADIEAFARDALGERMDVAYHEKLNDWTVASVERAITEWGFEKMSASQILDATLNNRQIKVTFRDQDGKTHVDIEATTKANDISQKMKDAFRRWIWTDAERADRLTRYYNENFNNIAPRAFDGSHLTLPGMSSRYALYDHQKRAVWRQIQAGDTYLAHAVGAGKTMEMIAGGMEQKRLGLIDKPVYAVPNHMLAQFAREFMELYPAANIMVADETNFHTHNRRRFIAQAALNNPDAIVMTHSSFGRVGMSEEFTKSYIEKQIGEWKEILAETDKGDRLTRKQVERRIEQLERRIEAKQATEKKDRVLTFEELGADMLFVDELHEFRKLDFATNQGNVKGIDPSGSQRAFDLMMKVEYLRGKKPGRSLVGASGTPVTNTMGELYTAQRLFQTKQLEEDGLTSFDAWANQYGDIVAGFEQNAAGGYEVVSRFAKFQNVPELMRRVRSFMDILTSSNLGELVKRPTVEGGQREVRITPAPDGYKEYQQELQKRITAIRQRKGPPKKGEDIILRVIGDGRFSAIDMRFVDPSRANDPGSKLNQMLDAVIEDYHAMADHEYFDTVTGKPDPIKGASHLIFTDIGLGEQSAASRGFDMRRWIEKRLTDGGVPADHIAFMRDYKQHAKKERLFADMREGKKRVLIGGKEMETGTNVQKRLMTEDHLDAPWFPSSVEQREGRIVRQGNQNKQVRIRAWATKGSYDSTMWGMNARKARFIEQAMNGDDTVRSLEDVSEASAFEMAAALASGDERYMKLAGLKQDVDRLERLRHAHFGDQRRLSVEKQYAVDAVDRNERRVADLTEAIKQRTPIRAGEFLAQAGKTEFDAREQFSAALFDEFKALTGKEFNGEQVIGRIGGFPITFYGLKGQGSDAYVAGVHVGIPGDPDPIITYPIRGEFAINGIAARAANQVNSLDRMVVEAKDRIEQSQRKIEQIDSRLGAPFPEEGELLEKVVALNNLENELTAEKAAEGGEQVSADAAAATVETEGESGGRASTPQQAQERPSTAARGREVNADAVGEPGAALDASRHDSSVSDEEGPRYSVAPGIDPEKMVQVANADTFDVAPESLYETANEWFKKNLQGTSVRNGALGGDIDFSRAGRSKMLSIGRRNPLRMAVVRALSDIAQNAVPVEFNTDRKGRENVEGYTTAIAPVEIDGKTYAVLLKTRRVANEGGRNVFYTVEGFDLKEPGDGGFGPLTKNPGRHSTVALQNSGSAGRAFEPDSRTAPSSGEVKLGDLIASVNDANRAFSVSGSPAEAGAKPAAGSVVPRSNNANGINVTELSMTLRDSNVGDLIGRLLDRGRVVLHDDAGSLPGKNAPRGVQASTMPDGTIHMVGANLSTRSAVPVLLHEMFHSGVKPLVGEAAWGKLMTRLDGLLRQSERSTGRAREFYDAALKRMRAAAHAGDARVMNAEEFGAYAIEEYSSAPAAVRAWVDDVVGAIKAWLLRRFGTQIGAVTPAQLRALAVAALRSEPRAGGDAPRNSVKAPMNPVEAGLTPPAPTRFDRFQAAVQDNMNRVKQVQERIKKLTGLKELGFADYYRAEANRPGRVAARLEDAQKHLTGPLMERLAKSGHTQAQLEELLHAQHAEERNEKIAEINKDMPEGGSGMMTAEANAILEKYKGATELKAIAQQARDIARATLDLKLAYGLIDQTTHDTLSSGYENYVPLKGDGEYGPKIKRAMGHEERAEHILENIARDYDQAVAAGEKNIARQSLLALVAEHEDPSLWTIGIPPRGRRIAGQVFNVVDPSLPKGQQTIGSFSARSQVDAFLEGAGPKAASYLVLDSGGERVQQFVRPLQDNEVMVYVKGEPVRIQIYDEALARQLRPLDQSKMHPILEFMRGMNRYLSKIYTGYNPAFILRNAARDALTGTVNMVGHEGAGVAAKAWVKYPGAVKALGQWAATGNAPAGKTGEYLKEYRMHGGKTGASWMSDLETKGKELSRMYEDAYGAGGYLKDGQNLKAAKVAGRKIVGGMAHVVEIANQATENALRLSLYMTLRESGASPGKAAQAAKSVTVDFDRKGTMTGALGAVYLFLNPAVQGTANAMRTLASGEHRGQAFAALGMLASLGFYAAASGMDDDKDRWLGEGWDARTKNFVMMFGDHTLKVPLSQEFTPAYAFGVAMAEAMRGEGAMKSAVRMVSSFLDAYFPLNGAYNPDSDNHLLDAAQAASPTIIKPLVETAVNRNHFGSPIVPETPATKSQPDNLKMYRGTKGTVYDALAQQIAAAGELTGAGRYENDITKISPETLKSVWRTYTGGLGQFVADSIGAASLATEPGEMSSSDIPIAKDFWRAQDVKPIRSRYYDLAREAKEAATEFQQAKKAGDGEAIDSIFARPGQAELIALDKMFKKSSHAAASIRDEEVTVNSDKSLSTAEKRNRLKELEKQEESIYRDALDVFKTSIPSK
ncbi:DarB-like antirestriction [Ralstonia phage AhaGv]|nr:DarB-like antirestriction [Ralstonia phage AhaGv]